MTALANLRLIRSGYGIPELGRLTANDAAHVGLTKMQRGMVVALEGKGYRFGFVHELTKCVVVIGDDCRQSIRPDGRIAWIRVGDDVTMVAGYES